MSMDFLPLIQIFLLAIYNGGKHLTSDRTKNVPWHILAPAAVACDIIIVRRSAHPAGGFLYKRKCNFLLYKTEFTKKYTRGGAPLHELCSLSLVFL